MRQKYSFVYVRIFERSKSVWQSPPPFPLTLVHVPADASLSKRLTQSVLKSGGGAIARVLPLGTMRGFGEEVATARRCTRLVLQDRVLA